MRRRVGQGSAEGRNAAGQVYSMRQHSMNNQWLVVVGEEGGAEARAPAPYSCRALYFLPLQLASGAAAGASAPPAQRAAAHLLPCEARRGAIPPRRPIRLAGLNRKRNHAQGYMRVSVSVLPVDDLAADADDDAGDDGGSANEFQKARPHCLSSFFLEARRCSSTGVVG